MNQPLTTSSDITYPTQSCIRHWDQRIGTTLGKLHLAAAYLARIGVGEWSDREIRKDWLKGQVGPLIREADPKDVLGDPNLCGMVRELFTERGVTRLRDKVAACATPNVETPTTLK